MSKAVIIVLAVFAGLLFLLFGVSGCAVGKYNSMVTQRESVNTSWSQVENQYQRRFDLIPNLVETVKGYATHEKSAFVEVAQARANAGAIKMTPQMLNDPKAMQQFQQAQGSLGTALSKLMVVVEKYPELKANENFLQLQAQLEGTENRIAVERKKFNESAQGYNTYIQKFPENILAGMFQFLPRPYFEAEATAKTAPKVKF